MEIKLKDIINSNNASAQTHTDKAKTKSDCLALAQIANMKRKERMGIKKQNKKTIPSSKWDTF